MYRHDNSQTRVLDKRNTWISVKDKERSYVSGVVSVRLATNSACRGPHPNEQCSPAYRSLARDRLIVRHLATSAASMYHNRKGVNSRVQHCARQKPVRRTNGHETEAGNKYTKEGRRRERGALKARTHSTGAKRSRQ